MGRGGSVEGACLRGSPPRRAHVVAKPLKRAGRPLTSGRCVHCCGERVQGTCAVVRPRLKQAEEDEAKAKAQAAKLECGAR